MGGGQIANDGKEPSESEREKTVLRGRASEPKERESNCSNWDLVHQSNVLFGSKYALVLLKSFVEHHFSFAFILNTHSEDVGFVHYRWCGTVTGDSV